MSFEAKFIDFENKMFTVVKMYKLHTLKVFYFRPCDENIVLTSVHSMQTSARHGLEKREHLKLLSYIKLRINNDYVIGKVPSYKNPLFYIWSELILPGQPYCVPKQ